MIVLLIVAFVAIAVLTLIVFGLLRTHADILRALDRAGISLDENSASLSAAPVSLTQPSRNRDAADIVGTVPGGGPVSVGVGGARHTLLAFMSSGCKTCATFWSEFESPALDLPGESTRLVIVAQDPAHDSESRLVELAPSGVRTMCSSAAWEAYDVPGSPYFVLIDGSTRKVTGSGTATNWPQVRQLLVQAIGDAKSGTAHSANGVSAELAAFGIGPGHPSLYPPDPAERRSQEDNE
ncbi:MAG: hypothetical protein F4Y27_03200 [Acidimicrobiaceae bacterium]|nr:hypothetical protein [Acidimicrobiaceae bacterium]MYA73669.1 hypothetical protein [Acidimicrobiaceae bacterium]MYC41199.1 hypothetical protein [Acidimicrobiaceae bacterium]MYG55795.1 hypothetical protein [Acidimicrobiaceae bacterium]MYJ97947.1 hypothetical protein [Acidimicrobiaceae bacterium]